MTGQFFRCSHLAFAGVLLLMSPMSAWAEEPKVEHVAHFVNDQPAGIAVTDEGRIFVTFPRHTGIVDFTVGEVKKGKTTAFPSAEANAPKPENAANTLFSVQSLVVDGSNRLWMLDTGVMQVGESPVPGAPKLTVIDLASNKVIRTYTIPSDALVGKSSLKDFRLDFSRSASGTAFITDSAPGAEALIVFDLGSGKAMRRLGGSTMVGPGTGQTPVVEGVPLIVRPKNGGAHPFAVGLNGVELSLDSQTLYFNAFTGRHLYSVPTRVAADTTITEQDLVKQVREQGDVTIAGHLAIDARGRIYAMDMEHNAILRKDAEGGFQPFVTSPMLIWPDTMAIGPDDKLYITSSQHNRGPLFHDGTDQRKRPFVLYRVGIGAGPVRAGRHNL
ncbi:sugar lactone lactonase YvrE [Bradyrhizobium elkanii]